MARRTTPDRPLTAAQQALVLSCRGLAWLFVRRLAGRLGGLCEADQEEAYGAAVDGLVRAARDYDPGHGVQFCTYAGWWVRQALERWQGRRARRLAGPGGRGLLWLSGRGPGRGGPDDGEDLQPPDPAAGPERLAAARDLCQRCRDVLPPSQWQALWLVGALGMTYEEAGAALGVSRTCVQQRLELARRNLRRRLAREAEVALES